MPRLTQTYQCFYLEETEVSRDLLPHRQADGVSGNELSGQQVLQVPLPDTEEEDSGGECLQSCSSPPCAPC